MEQVDIQIFFLLTVFFDKAVKIRKENIFFDVPKLPFTIIQKVF